MNFPSSRSSPSLLSHSVSLSLSLSDRARNSAELRCPGTSLHVCPLPPAPLLPSIPRLHAHIRVQTRRIHASVEHLRANLARLWKQFTSRRLSSRGCMDGWVGRGLESAGVNEKREERERRETRTEATGWPETALEHCNSSNVSFMQNTC